MHRHRQGLSLRGPEIALAYNEEVKVMRGKGLSEWEESVQSQKCIRRLVKSGLVNTSMRVLSFL